MRDHDRSLPLLLALLALPLAGCPTPSEDDDESLFGDLDAIVSEERPTKRSEVIAVAHEAGGEILMFGGNDAPIVDQIPRAAYRDDTWIFQAGVGWSELSVDGPHARGRYGATYDADGGRALLFGGRFREDGGSGNYDLFDDLWAFDFESGTWDELDADGGPSARYYPQLAWYDGALYVYGGLTNADPLAFQRSDELWKWTDGDGWEEISTSGDAPSPRAFYGTALDSARGHLVLFAGQVGDFQSLAFNDLYSLDLESGAWQELDNGGNGAPFTRMHPHIQYDGTRDRILLFGGHTDIGDDNDLWEFPAGGGEWDRIAEGDAFTGEGFGCLGNPSEVPSDYVEVDMDFPERRQKAMVALMYDNLWVFGGMHAECSEHLDDTWRYDLATGDWTELIEARTGESCVRRGDDCECLCL